MDDDPRVVEARAKLIWGESPAQVFKFMQGRGIPERQAAALLAGFKQERNAMIRSIGIAKIIRGAGLVCVPIVTWTLFHLLGFMLEKILILSIVAGLYGAWKIVSGLMQISLPSAETSDITQMEE